MNLKRLINFAAKVVLVHTVTYFIIGALAYQFLTKQFYEGDNPIFRSFMRTPAEPDLWRHVMTWFIPAQIMRGVLIALAVYPFYETLEKWNFVRRFSAWAGLYLLLGYWACAVAAPGTIDGLVYMRPTITPQAHLLVQPEIIVQGLAMATWLALWGKAK